MISDDNIVPPSKDNDGLEHMDGYDGSDWQTPPKDRVKDGKSTFWVRNENDAERRRRLNPLE